MSENQIEIHKNELLRQFEYKIDRKIIKLEYSEQGKNIFLTRLEMDKSITQSDIKDVFLKSILNLLSKENVYVVPTCPLVARFFKNHRNDYKQLLPKGMNL